MTDLVCISPVDGREYARRPAATSTQIDSAIAAELAAQREWAEVPLSQRQDLVRRFLKELTARNDAIVPELAWQMGRPVRYGGELRSLTERIEAIVADAPAALALHKPTPRAGFRRFVERRPVGLVLVIAPWNYPFLTAANAIVPALLAGNAVLLKPSAQTLLVGERFAAALAAAGLPAGLFANLFLTHEDTERLLASGLLGHAVFTGSVAAGRTVERAAAGTSLTLELGGKDPAYVRADADLDRAVADLVDGAYYNSGQSCCAVERIYVDQSLWQPFVDRFVAAVEQYRLGDPLDPGTSLGPVANPRVAATVRGQIADALAGGAKAHVDPAEERGLYLTPQVLTGVDHGMAVMREESFGPVVGIMPVSGDEQAIALMNDSRFGLTASIWTDDVAAAERIGVRLETGTVFLNRCDYVDPGLAWTGVKDSGRGASLGPFGFAAMTRPRSFHFAGV